MCMSGKEVGLGERDEKFCFRCSEFRWFGTSQLGSEFWDLGTVRAAEDKTWAETIPWNVATDPHCEEPTEGSLPEKDRPLPKQGFSNFTPGKLT